MDAFSQSRVLTQGSTARRHDLASIWIMAREAFWIALETLRSHKLRSFLTLLGVVISTTTLIVVMSVVNGMNNYIAEHIANLGANVFVLQRYPIATSFEEYLKALRRNKLIRMEDYEFLKENLSGYKNIGAEVNFPAEVRYRGHVLDEVQIGGETPSMIDMSTPQVDSGRYITDTDEVHESMVCFLGRDVADQLFPSVDPIDKVIQIQGKPFRVVGIAQRIGTTFGQSSDNYLHIPLTTYRKFFQSQSNLWVRIQAFDADQMRALQDQVRALMRARHHLPYHETDDFGISASESIMGIWQQLTGSIFAVTIAVVAVFMVVGGIVIMNIMLASVTERTHEIGIRKSLGARRRDILAQFVIESAVMAATGGVVGVLLAVLISSVIQMFFAAKVPFSGVLLGIVLSTAVGLFFGIYPASQAAKLDPIEALRTEN
jgi:putative ABC transport system permease protein